MLSKKSEEFIQNLRMYLLTSGKNEREIEELIGELKDHLTEAEKEGRSIDDIIDGSPEAYMTSIKKEMKTDYKSIIRLLPIYFFGVFAYFFMGPAIRGEFQLNYIEVIGYPVVAALGFIMYVYFFQQAGKKQYSSKKFFFIAMIAYFIVTILLISVMAGGKLLVDPFFIGTPTSDVIVIALCSCILIAAAKMSKTWYPIIIPVLLFIPDVIHRFVELSINMIIVVQVLSIVVVFGGLIIYLLVSEKRKNA